MCSNHSKNLKLILLFLVTLVSVKSFAIKDDSNFNYIDLSNFKSNAFIDPDLDTGKLLATYHNTTQQNPEELGPYYEGDILIPLRNDKRNGLLAQSFRWQKNIVPYEILGNFTCEELQTINWAFGEYHKRTCIRFKLRSRERDYISIVNGNTGCWSAVGRIGGKQNVNFQSPLCILSRGTVLHEFMHVLGFMHEHNRFDRDKYIVIHSENIRNNSKGHFEKLSVTTAHGMGIGYDYTSVMHYAPLSFSKNGKPTIEAKKDTRESKLMGQRLGFSKLDVAKINIMYKCKVKNIAQGTVTDD